MVFMRLVLLALLLTPLSAHAEPATLTAIGAFVAAYGVYVQIALTIGAYIYGNAQQRKAKRRARDEYNAGLQDRTISRVATEAPHVYVYGQARVGSAIVAIFTSGDKDQYKYMVCIHAAHECEAIDEIYIASKPVGVLDGTGLPTGGAYFKLKTEAAQEIHLGASFALGFTPDADSLAVAVSGTGSISGDNGVVDPTLVPFTLSGNVVTITDPAYVAVQLVVAYTYQTNVSTVKISKHLGTPTDPADAMLLAELNGKWPATAVLRGFCYTVVRLDLNQAEFQSGNVQIEALVRGKKVLDPRTGLTAWSDNPALCTYDYLTSEMCGVDAADIPVAQVITAANVCDEAIGTNIFGPIKRYTMNGSVTSDQPQPGVLEAMAQSMAGGICATTWDIWSGKYVAPVRALLQSDIVGSLAITPGLSDADVYNTIVGQYISAENGYVATDFKPYQNPAYLAADGKQLTSNIDFQFTNSLQRIHNLARIFTEDQRNGFTIKAEFSLKAWSLKVGQRVTFTSALFGQNAKVYRITDKSYSPTSAVELTLKEDAPSIWDLADAVTVDATPNSDLPDPFEIARLASITCASGTDQLLRLADGTLISRILVSWPQATTGSVVNGGQIQVEFQKIGSSIWSRITADGAETQTYINGVADRMTYIVRARCVSHGELQVKSDWVYANHTVVGKTELPANIQNLSIAGTILTWMPSTEADFAGYKFRFHYGTNLDWRTATPLHDGYVSGSPFDLVTRPNGAVTIMGKAFDTSGNESAQTANIFTDLGNAAIANVVQTFNLQTMLWPADSLTGGTVVAGEIVANAIDSFYSGDDQSFYGPEADSFYAPGTYTQLVYTTKEIQVTGALPGSLLSLSITTFGVDLKIEYRLVGPSSFYGSDGDPFYTTDADPFYDGPGAWQAWPGQIVADNDVYQFRVTIGPGVQQCKISAMSVIVDAPEIEESLADLVISASGTAIPYAKTFHRINTVIATLQAGTSGAVRVDVDKTNNLAPVIRALNSSNVAVSGASADLTIKGY
jgi:hypothetical protein